MADNGLKLLHGVVDDLVVAQGNEFVKELLRKKGLRIGTTKAAFESSLHSAIDSGDISSSDIEQWLNEVEGWGAHHVYLHRIDKDALGELLQNHRKLAGALKRAGFSEIRKEPRPFEFPEDLIATSVRVDGLYLEVVWHQGTESWPPDSTKDREEVIEGDRYKLKAFRRRADRSVARLAVDAGNGLAGIFIGIPLSEEEAHLEAMKVMRESADILLRGVSMKPINIGTAQLRLDHAGREANRGVTSTRSRIHGSGAYVEFGSSSHNGNYSDVDAIRQVRLAVQTDLKGESGDFDFTLPSKTVKNRIVRVSLNATDQRIYIRAQMTYTEEWTVLRQIAEV